MSVNIDEIVRVLRQGHNAAIPTETVYGLAGSINSDAAIENIFKLKQRPADHPLIVHIANKTDLYKLSSGPYPKFLDRLISYFWPGPLTIVLRSSDLVSKRITADQDTVAIRMPSHPIALNVIQALGSPIAAPSANRFGKLSPTTAEHVRNEFGETLAILDGGRCDIGIESTIIDLTSEDRIQIIREGIITGSDIQACLTEITVTSPATKPKMRISGNLEQHYCPNKPLYQFSNKNEFKSLAQKYNNALYVLSLTSGHNADFSFDMPKDPKAFAYQLYFQLHIADSSPIKAIAIEQPPKTPGWEAIHDRLKRAITKE